MAGGHVAAESETTRTSPAPARWLPASLLRDERLPLVGQAVAIWALTRAGFVVVSFVALLWADRTNASGRGLLGQWVEWDASWYLGIARDLPHLFTVSFFPVYPVLVAAVTAVVGAQHQPLAGLLVSNGAMLIGIVCVARLGFAETKRGDSALGAVRAAVAYPLAYTTFAPLSEGVFFTLVVVALLASRLPIWWLAALSGSLAAMTRPTGVILAPVLLLEYASQAGWFAKNRTSPRLHGQALIGGAALFAAPVAGLALVMFGEWLSTGDPLRFAHIQQSFWHHQFLPPWESVRLFIDHWYAPTAQYDLMVIDGLAILGFGALTLASVTKVPMSFTVFMLLLLATTVAAPIPNYPDVYASAARYLVVAIPVFLVIGRYIARHPALDFFIVGTGFLLQGLFAVHFIEGRWVS